MRCNKHQVEQIYGFPSTNGSTNISSEQDTGSTFEGLQSEVSKDFEWNFDLYLVLL